jgi:hypothetical protein
MYCTTEECQQLQNEITAVVRQEVSLFVDWMAQREVTPSLEDIEEQVHKLVFRLGLDLLQGAVNLIGPGYQTEGPECECGAEMKFERYQPKSVLTVFGPLTVRRAYYTCTPCHQGRAPLDYALRLDHTGLSGGLQNGFCRTVGRMSYEEAIQFLTSLHYPEIPATTGRRLTLEVGQELRRQQEQVVAESWRTTQPPPMEQAEPPLRLYISMDGTSVHLTRGWSEMRLAAVYETEDVRQKDGSVVPRTVRPTYLPFRGNVEDFGQLVYVEAARRGLEKAGEVIVLGDGAKWIWRQARHICPEAVCIIDWWHATEHLWRAARALLGEGNAATEEWEKAREAELWEGQVEKVLAALQQALPAEEGEAQKVVQEEITYFTNQRSRMRYDEYRACGYQIGSGTVESACKRVIGQRLKQAGMIWSEEQAVAVATIRAALLDGRWNDFWRRRAFTPRRRQVRVA